MAKRNYDAVVIGAGAFGCSAAYHLAKAGLRTALVDRSGVARQTTTRAAGLTSQAQAVEVFARLQVLSIAKLARFTEETGEPLEVHRVGSLKLARSEADDRLLDDDLQACQDHGVALERIDPRDATALAPWLDASGVVGATYAPGDVYVEEPAPLPIGYAAAGRRHGLEVITTAVRGISRGSTFVVNTDDGDFSTGVVVDTAGAWARLVAEMAGIRVPLVPVRHQLLVTDPVTGVRSSQPICRVMDVNVYVRPCRGGLMLGGYEPDPMVFPEQGPGDQFDVADLQLDRSVLDRLAAQVAEQLPVFSRPGLGIQDFRGGLPTMTPDGLAFLGAVPGADGFLVAAGCCVFGFSISPIAGETIANLVTGEPVAQGLDLEPLRLDRFSGPEWDDESVRRAAIATYGHRYTSGMSARP